MRVENGSIEVYDEESLKKELVELAENLWELARQGDVTYVVKVRRKYSVELESYIYVLEAIDLEEVLR